MIALGTRAVEGESSFAVTVIPAFELDGHHIAQWAAVQESQPILGSPFFRPEFTLAVGEVRRDAFVGIMERDARIIGYFPFQRGRFPIGYPIGAERSNYQGVITAAETPWNAQRLIRECGLHIWDFHHLLVAQSPFSPFISRVVESPCLDISEGFDTYARSRGEDGSRVIRRLFQQVRRIEREIGPLRFEPHTSSQGVLHTMMRWKSEQYRATGAEDRFATPWNVELLERIHSYQAVAFQGMPPALYAGDTLAAVAMCMRSHHVFHYWFPAYNHDLASYSLGLLLLLKLAESAESLGLKMIDLGKGRTPYKDRMANAAINVAEGSVVVPSVSASIRAARNAAERSIGASAFRGPARRTLRLFRSLTRRTPSG